MMHKDKLRKLTFENQLLRLTLLIGLIPTSFFLYIFYSYELSVYPKIIIVLFLLTFVIYGAFSIRQQLVFRLRTSTNLMEAMIFGDYSMRAHQRDTDGALDDFNYLLNSLAESLAEQRMITKEKQILLHKVITQIDVAIIALDNNNHINLMNPAAENLFNCSIDNMQGTSINQLDLQEALKGESRKIVEFELSEYKKRVYIRTDEFFEKGIKQKLIFITDIQNILREEERKAWQKLLRVLRHEINNSLAPIASISETLYRHCINNQTQHEFSSDLLEGLSLITERSNSLSEFIQSYQQLTTLPPPNKTLFDIVHLMNSIVLLFENSNIKVMDEQAFIYADENQLKQVLLNLIKNAQEAMQDKPSGEICISWTKRPDRFEIQLTDEGLGINNIDNLFVPFYTTKPEGSGIGLVLSRQILMNHSGDLVISNRVESPGAKAIIYLPNIEK